MITTTFSSHEHKTLK